MALLAIVLAGCQQQTENLQTPAGDQNKPPAQDQTGIYGKPYSNGPSGPPQMTGPTAPPPEVTPAQAVTTNENIRLTLPRKTE